MKSISVRRLLVVEDEVEIREILIESLVDLGVEVQVASDGVEALEFMEKVGPKHFQAVITDIQMPRMTGLELVTELHARGFTVPIIIVSAHGEKEKILQVLRLGAFDFIEKPFSMKELFDVVSRALDFGARVQRLESNPSLTNNKRMMALLKVVNNSKRKVAS